MSRVRVGLWLIILLLLTNDMRQFSGQVFDVNRLAGMDYFGYWSCGRVFMQGGNCYNSEIVHPVQKSEGRREQDTLISWNPPWTYILLLPILKFSFPLGRIVWFLLSVFMLIWAADFFWIWAGGPVGRRHLAWLCAFLFVPCAVSLNLGQITPLLMVGLAGFMWCIQKKRDLSAGIILIFLSTKPQVVYIFVLFLLLWIWQERRWKILYGLVNTDNTRIGMR